MRRLAALLLLAPLAAQAGEVTVIRPSAFIGAETTYYIALDGRPLRDIESREHVRFDVPPGRHVLAVRCPKPLTLEYAETRLEADFGAAPAFFAIEPKFDCVALTRLDARAAAPLLGNTTLRADTGTSFEEGRVQASAPVQTQPAPPPGEGAPALAAAWADAFNSRDAAGLAALYDAQAVLIGLRSKAPLVGAAAIAAYYDEALKRPLDRVALGEHSVRRFGDTAVDSGLYNVFEVDGGRATVTAARYTLVSRMRDDGKWRIVEHHSSRVP